MFKTKIFIFLSKKNVCRNYFYIKCEKDLNIFLIDGYLQIYNFLYLKFRLIRLLINISPLYFF